MEQRVTFEEINQRLYLVARNKSFDLYREAVLLGIISAGQAEGLMSLWLKRHPYEPLVELDESEEDE